MLAAGYEARPVVLEREFNLRYRGESVTFQAVRRWLRGESIPEQDKLIVLAEWLGVDPQELRFGVAAQDASAPAVRRTDLTRDEEELLKTYRTLPAELRKALRELVLTIRAGSK